MRERTLGELLIATAYIMNCIPVRGALVRTWPSFIAWNLTLASLCCEAACRAYNNGSSDSDSLCSAFLAGRPEPGLLGPYPHPELEQTKDGT